MKTTSKLIYLVLFAYFSSAQASSYLVQYQMPAELSAIFAEALWDDRGPLGDYLEVSGLGESTDWTTAVCDVEVLRPGFGEDRFATPSNKIRCELADGSVTLSFGETPVGIWGTKFGPKNTFSVKGRSEVGPESGFPLPGKLQRALARRLAKQTDAVPYFKTIQMAFSGGDQLWSVDLLHPQKGTSMVSCDQWGQLKMVDGEVKKEFYFYCAFAER